MRIILMSLKFFATLPDFLAKVFWRSSNYQTSQEEADQRAHDDAIDPVPRPPINSLNESTTLREVFNGLRSLMAWLATMSACLKRWHGFMCWLLSLSCFIALPL
jgi:hypothetical protein